MANSLFDNIYLGSFDSGNIASYSMKVLKSRETRILESSYIIRQDEPDGRKKVCTTLTMKELETILKHIPNVELNSSEKHSWSNAGIDVTDPSSLPYVFPDYDTTRLQYDLIYDTIYHDKMLTVLSLWLSMPKHEELRLFTSNLCQEILL